MGIIFPHSLLTTSKYSKRRMKSYVTMEQLYRQYRILPKSMDLERHPRHKTLNLRP